MQLFAHILLECIVFNVFDSLYVNLIWIISQTRLLPSDVSKFLCAVIVTDVCVFMSACLSVRVCVSVCPFISHARSCTLVSAVQGFPLQGKLAKLFIR